MLTKVTALLNLKVKLSLLHVQLNGDEDLTVNLGEVADTVLKSDQKSLAEPFTIHLQDCMLSRGGTTYSKAKVTFTTANTMTGQTDLLKTPKKLKSVVPGRWRTYSG